MAVKKGRDFLLKEGTVSAGVTTVAALRTTNMTVNNELVDITNKDSAGYRTLLEGAGMQSISINAEGPFDDVTIAETIRGYSFANSINSFVLVFPNGDTLECSFQIGSYERAGDHNNEETYSMTLESSGQWTYTPAA